VEIDVRRSQIRVLRDQVWRRANPPERLARFASLRADAALDFVDVSVDMQARGIHYAPSHSRRKRMPNLIARVATAADTTPEVARQAIALVVDFIKRDAPEDATNKLLAKAPGLKAIVASVNSTGGEGMGDTVKGLMGVSAGSMGGGGIMALGAQLMGLGLGMAQIQTIGKEIFGYAREVAGDDVVGEIAAAIPGLSQFI
jgi:hypothetical protein